MVSNFTETMRANVSRLRELQASFNEAIGILCTSTVERIMKGELEDEFPDDTREVRTQTNHCFHSKTCFVFL